MQGNHWAKWPADFAVRVDVDDVPGLFRRDLVVEAGTRALILVDGRDTAGDLGPGKYTLQRSGLMGTTRATAILVDAGDVPLAFEFERLLTADPLFASVTLEAVVTVESAALLATTLLRGATRFGVEELRLVLYDTIEDACREFLGSRSAADLEDTLARKEELAHHIAMHTQSMLERSGLRLVEVRALRIQVDDSREVTAEAAAAEHRVAAYNRLRRAALAAKKEELAGEAEIERLVRTHDGQRVLGQAEHERLLADVRAAKEDAELNRSFVVKRMEMLQTFELDKLKFEHERALLELERQKREVMLQSELDRERIAGIHRAETRLKVREVELTAQLAEAKSGAEIARLEREQDRLDLDLALWATERMDALKHQRQRQEMLLRLEEEEARLRMEIERRRAEQEIEERQLKAWSEASADAILALTSNERAPIFADLRKTEIMRGMTDQQILAMAAERSPEIAKAFQELFRAHGTDAVVTEANQRAFDAERRAKEEMAAQHKETMAIWERITNKALETQRDTAVAAARGRAPQDEALRTSGRCPNGHGTRPAGEMYCPICSEGLIRD